MKFGDRSTNQKPITPIFIVFTINSDFMVASELIS